MKNLQKVIVVDSSIQCKETLQQEFNKKSPNEFNYIVQPYRDTLTTNDEIQGYLIWVEPSEEIKLPYDFLPVGYTLYWDSYLEYFTCLP